VRNKLEAVNQTKKIYAIVEKILKNCFRWQKWKLRAGFDLEIGLEIKLFDVLISDQKVPV